MALRALERLNPRERRLVSALGVVFGVGLVLAVPIGLESIVHAREADNQELAAALAAVQEARGQVRERQEKKEALLQRYARKAPPLAGFLEQAAQVQKLEVENSDDRPAIPHGKRYTERSTNVHLKKSGLLPIVKFLETIEKSGYPIEVSRLVLRKRLGENDMYDVEVGVTAYDRADAVAAPVPMPVPLLPTLPGIGSASSGATASGTASPGSVVPLPSASASAAGSAASLGWLPPPAASASAAAPSLGWLPPPTSASATAASPAPPPPAPPPPPPGAAPVVSGAPLPPPAENVPPPPAPENRP